MRDGVASYTARRVAAHRLDYQRAEAPYGDPAADTALNSDVAQGITFEPSRMHEYLRARTAFFDQTVVRALAAGAKQVVVGGAGYDGRSLRYAKPGVHWFEVDHPDTQADKLERLERLGLGTGHVRFVPADFTQDPVADRLRSAGLATDAPALFLLEGVAAYLETGILRTLLAEFRRATAPGALLAISVSLTAGATSRARFRESVAAAGEPLRSVLEPGEADELLARAGWQVTRPGEKDEQLRGAGLLSARAVPA